MKNKKYLVGFAIIIGAVIYLLSTSFQSSLQYYISVHELLADVGRYEDKTLKLAGKAGPIEQTNEGGRLTYRFTVIEGEDSIPVVYTGFVPDTFKEGSEVVVTGVFNSQQNKNGRGEFLATDILAKCASKYQAKMDGQ